MTEEVTQQEFLRSAMAELGMTREQFAKRMGIKLRTLNSWLLPAESDGFRPLPDIAWSFVKEILEHEALKRLTYTHRV